jgi:proline iminopeptidase
VADQVNDRGLLDVGQGHRIYWEDWGNPSGVPVIFLHGGPGGGFNDTHKGLFDPGRHHVLFHDQRGCGRSTPFAETSGNTTADLINDVEALRRQVGWSSAHVVGGSWGSTLGLLYAIAHPQQVRSMVLWSIYLARQFDDEWVMNGPPRFFFPREWERFTALIPPQHRTSPSTMVEYYNSKIRDEDTSIAHKHAVEWTLWEKTLTSLDYDPVRDEQEVETDPATLAVARLEAHYFINGCFVPENHIINEVPALRDLPCTVVQGRFDMCTPPIGAHDLAQAYGDNLDLHWVNSGHLRTDPEMHAALRAALKALH